MSNYIPTTFLKTKFQELDYLKDIMAVHRSVVRHYFRFVVYFDIGKCIYPFRCFIKEVCNFTFYKKINKLCIQQKL